MHLNLNLLEAHEFRENIDVLFFKAEPDHLFDVFHKLVQALALRVTPFELRNFSYEESALVFLDPYVKLSTWYFRSLLFSFFVWGWRYILPAGISSSRGPCDSHRVLSDYNEIIVKVVRSLLYQPSQHRYFVVRTFIFQS